MEFSSVTAVAKANIFFDGGVISHTIFLPDGSRKTLGVIRPGSWHFTTAVEEEMRITDGDCEVTLDGESKPAPYTAGGAFRVPAKTGFTIAVKDGHCQYVCSFLG